MGGERVCEGRKGEEKKLWTSDDGGDSGGFLK